MEKKSRGKKILEILQENYEIESTQDLSSAIKDLFKDSLQEMMNAEFETSMSYQKYDNKTEKTNYRNGKTKKKSFNNLITDTKYKIKKIDNFTMRLPKKMI